MKDVRKATIGIAFADRIFRISSVAGSLIDELLKLRGKELPAEYFSTVARDPYDNSITIYGQAEGAYFNVSQDSIAYTYDLYESKKILNYATFVKEFESIWKTTHSVLQLPAIRRIGFVTEQRVYAGKMSNNMLLERFTGFKPSGFPARVSLSFDERFNTGHGGLPDPTKDDFDNFIRTYDDSALDVQHPVSDAINGNLDVQRYYSPAFVGQPVQEIAALKERYDKIVTEFNIDLEALSQKHEKAAA